MTASLHTLSGELLDDLIARLEKATGPDWGLDRDIARLDFVRERIGDLADDEVPAYTASIDAALSLVPEVMCVDLRRCDDGKSGYAEIRESDTTPDGVDDELYVWSPMCPSPAIALCIAALKARKQ